MTATGPAADTPNWDALTVEVRCPRCGYDLRMLPQARCPECGLEFRWAKLIAEAQQPRTFSYFEYRWRDRPVRSFLATIWRALLPWRLWGALRTALAPRTGPLLALLALALLLSTAVTICAEFACAAALLGRYGGYRRVLSHNWGVWIQARLSAWSSDALGVLVLVTLIWLALQLFRQSLARQHIRQLHLLRVLVLSTAAFFGWIAIGRVFFAGREIAWHWWRVALGGPWMSLVEAWPARLVLPISLCLALSWHLRLKQGWLGGIVAVVLAIAAPTIAVLVVSVYGYDSLDNTLVHVLDGVWPWITEIGRRLLTGEKLLTALW
jgi:hypothetical protein